MLTFHQKWCNIYFTTESYGSIAQLGEHLPYKQRVTGSSPVVPTIISVIYAGLAHLVERHLAKVEVASSSLVTRSIFFLKKLWEHSSAGRASALQAEGHRFEPCCSHHTFGPVVQLVRTLACHARGRGFEPHSGRQMCASVAQSVEQGTENPRVVGSIPTGGTTNMRV